MIAVLFRHSTHSCSRNWCHERAIKGPLPLCMSPVASLMLNTHAHTCSRSVWHVGVDVGRISSAEHVNKPHCWTECKVRFYEDDSYPLWIYDYPYKAWWYYIPPMSSISAQKYKFIFWSYPQQLRKNRFAFITLRTRGAQVLLRPLRPTTNHGAPRHEYAPANKSTRSLL
jgi:hypothetical protein